jgi:hypothetical protein
MPFGAEVLGDGVEERRRRGGVALSGSDRRAAASCNHESRGSERERLPGREFRHAVSFRLINPLMETAPPKSELKDP